MHVHDGDFKPDFENQVDVRFEIGQWFKRVVGRGQIVQSQEPANREEIMMVLENIELLLIRYVSMTFFIISVFFYCCFFGVHIYIYFFFLIFFSCFMFLFSPPFLFFVFLICCWSSDLTSPLLVYHKVCKCVLLSVWF